MFVLTGPTFEEGRGAGGRCGAAAMHNNKNKSEETSECPRRREEQVTTGGGATRGKRVPGISSILLLIVYDQTSAEKIQKNLVPGMNSAINTAVRWQLACISPVHKGTRR